jgi:hypothetical protein
MMNERIKRLATEVGISVEYLNNTKQWVLIEALSELIVRECAGLFPNVYVEIKTDYGHTPVIAADYIKQHFGVEE